jgi:hypothetical protein
MSWYEQCAGETCLGMNSVQGRDVSTGATGLSLPAIGDPNTFGVSTGATRLSLPSIGDPNTCGVSTGATRLSPPSSFSNHYSIQYELVLYSGDYIKENEMSGACGTHCGQYRQT